MMRKRNFLINTVVLSLLVVGLLLVASAIDVPEDGMVRRVNILSRVMDDSDIDNLVAGLSARSKKNMEIIDSDQSNADNYQYFANNGYQVQSSDMDEMSESLAIQIELLEADGMNLNNHYEFDTDTNNVHAGFVNTNHQDQLGADNFLVNDYSDLGDDRGGNYGQNNGYMPRASAEGKYTSGHRNDSIMSLASQRGQRLKMVIIEDYTESMQSEGSLSQFWQKLKDCKSGIMQQRPLRIIMLGDSFIESDLLSSDLRAKLQTQFGGQGLGYVQIASPQAPFSRNVRHRWDGWVLNSAMSKPRGGVGYLPSLINYTINGDKSSAESAQKYVAYAEWSIDTVKQPMLQYRVAKIAYTYSGNQNINLGVRFNDGATQQIEIEGHQAVGNHSTLRSMELGRQIVADGDRIYKLRIDVPNVRDFVIHGVWLESRNGVILDNLSLRGNSGVLVGSIDANLTRQLQRISPTDLIVMSYGLNVVEANRRDYSKYMQQMQLAVDNLRYAMPDVPILVLGVSDRLGRTNHGTMMTMQGVVALEQEQRSFAQRNGLAFWSMYDAMQKLGGMQKFVDNGWAAKDYTHIGWGGGRRLAQELYDAIMIEYNEYCESIKRNSRSALVLQNAASMSEPHLSGMNNEGV